MTDHGTIQGYTLLQPFTNAGGGQSRWAFARRGGTEYFLKEFLKPTYPLPDGPGGEPVKRKKLARCAAFQAHHEGIMRALKPLSSSGGNLVVTQDFFRDKAKYYKVTVKVDVASIAIEGIAALPIKSRLNVLLAVTTSLGILHRHGLVHGDIKPGNILIKEQGAELFSAKLIDFDDCFLSGRPPHPDDVVGDPPYYSPELSGYLAGEAPASSLTTGSDMFALGLVFCQYLTGRLPTFDTDAYHYACDAVRAGASLGIGGDGLPAALVGLVRDMLHPDPTRRPDCAKVHETLKRIRSLGDAPAPGPTPAGSRIRGALIAGGRATGERPLAHDGEATGGAEPPPPPEGGPSRLRGSLVRKARKPPVEPEP